MRWLRLLLIANTINIGADLGAMAAALRLLIAGPHRALCRRLRHCHRAAGSLHALFALCFVLRWLTLSLFAYVATVFVVSVPMADRGARIWSCPHIKLSGDYLTVVVAVFGTTISPYLFFWQAAEEVEDEKEDPALSRCSKLRSRRRARCPRIQLDTLVGMGLSNLVALFIILTTAATLNAHGMTDIQTSSQAAEALRPIAGNFAFTIFALGIIGTGLLALPVLAGSAAYAVGEALGWRVGLAQRPGRARSVLRYDRGSDLRRRRLNFTPLDPIKALFWSAVINGVAAVPIMAMIMLMASRRP